MVMKIIWKKATSPEKKIFGENLLCVGDCSMGNIYRIYRNSNGVYFWDFSHESITQEQLKIVLLQIQKLKIQNKIVNSVIY